MNALMNETQLWYCNICDKTINIKSKPKLTHSDSHKHKEKYSVVVKKINLLDETIVR